MSIDPKHVPYARETAICVDLAYDSMEGDLMVEIEHATGAHRESLLKLLSKLRARRQALAIFTKVTGAAA